VKNINKLQTTRGYNSATMLGFAGKVTRQEMQPAQQELVGPLRHVRFKSGAGCRSHLAAFFD
jgi:hypothetical protein